MKGLELSRAYYEEYGRPMLETCWPQVKDLAAIGLVGPGSECFGFDDMLSQDHDFGPGFCIWLPDEVFEQTGAKMQESYDALPDYFEGFVREDTPARKGRVGVFSIGGFYRSLIGRADVPQTNYDWFVIPDMYLAAAVNGEVFYDPFGQFSAVRKGLLSFYPADVMKKKLAAGCSEMAQSGQYNYTRAIRRRSYETAALSCTKFVMAALGVIYLLEGKYKPFYKWAFRGTENFTYWSGMVSKLRDLLLLSDEGDYDLKIMYMEKICIQVRDAIINLGWTKGTETFLWYHAEQIMKSVSDPLMRSLPITAGI